MSWCNSERKLYRNLSTHLSTRNVLRISGLYSLYSRIQYDCCIFTNFPCIFQIPSYRPFLPQAQRLIGKMLYETSRLEYECWRRSFIVAGRCNLLKSVSFGFTPRPSLVYRVGHHDGLLTTYQPLVQHGSGSTILPHWAQLVFFGTTSCPVVRNST